MCIEILHRNNIVIEFDISYYISMEPGGLIFPVITNHTSLFGYTIADISLTCDSSMRSNNIYCFRGTLFCSPWDLSNFELASSLSTCTSRDVC